MKLTDVISAREQGLDPNAGAALRRETQARKRRTEDRRRAEWRLILIGVAFVLAYGAVAARMVVLAASEPREPTAIASSERFSAVRGEIVDRRGRLMAANLPVWSLYARPQEMVDPKAAATGLAKIFPDLNKARLLKDFTGARTFLWVKRSISPAERVAVHDLGEPGLKFGPREERIYPAGHVAGHILGGASFGKQGVRAAEVVGVAGVERYFDARLRDPAEATTPLALSIDLRVQSALDQVLGAAMARFHARGAAAVLMDARNGEVLALSSLPDFDPNARPAPPTKGRQDESPLFNRAAQGVYELGSTFKLLTAAMVIEEGFATPETMVDTAGPIRSGRFRIRDLHRMPDRMTLTDVIVQSSNVGTARLAVLAGASRQRDFLDRFGLLDATPLEIAEARRGAPLIPRKWSELSTMTISYGHGIAATPLHLAAAYGALVNGGYRLRPTLLKGAPAPGEDDRVISERTSLAMRQMLRAVVTDGTGGNADAPGYFVGGKTGSAEKPRRDGRGYHRDKVIATFAAVFPASDPDYVLVITLDEAEDRSGRITRRTAGWTAAPTTRAAIERIAPLLGMRPHPHGIPSLAPETHNVVD